MAPDGAPRVPAAPAAAQELERMQVADYEIETVVDAHFALDGGAMFGVVPRPLWERHSAPDERNRIELAARCLLIRGRGRCILVDTGIGDRFADEEREIFKVRPHEGGLVEGLRSRGVTPEEVTDVVLTHLHFDHCGGTVTAGPAGRELTFPDATHHVQRRHWEWARAPSDKDAGSFRPPDFEPIDDAGRLHLVDGPSELFEGIDTLTVDGHTPAMQLVRIRDEQSTVLFLADLVPTRAHLRWPWIMAYDNRPLETLAEKRRYLPEAAEEGWILVLQHDPECEAIVLQATGDRVGVAREPSLSRR